MSTSITIPKELVKELEKYPDILSKLKLVYHKPSLPTGYEPSRVEIYCDNNLGVEWVTGTVIYEMPCKVTYEPEILSWVIDGELVCILLCGKEPLFDRLQNPINMPDLDKAPRT